MEKIFLGWDEITALINEIQKDTSHLDSSKNAIIGIARGGLIPAVMLSHLKDNIPVYAIGTRSYKEEKRQEDVIYQELNLDEIKQYSNIFVVDDICDTGKTFLQIKNKILHPSLISCSIIYREDAAYKPDYYGVQILDKKWIVFPWEKHK